MPTFSSLFMPMNEIEKMYSTEAQVKMGFYAIFWAAIPFLTYFNIGPIFGLDWWWTIAPSICFGVWYLMHIQSGMQHRGVHEVTNLWSTSETLAAYLVSHRARHWYHHEVKDSKGGYFIHLLGILYISLLDAVIGFVALLPFAIYFVNTYGWVEGMTYATWCYQWILISITWWMAIFEMGHFTDHNWWMQIPFAWDIVAPAGHQMHHITRGVGYYSIYYNLFDVVRPEIVREILDFQGRFEPAWLKRILIADSRKYTNLARAAITARA